MRFKTPGWAEAKLKASTGTVWATWGPYLRKSLLIKLGETLGDTSFPEDFVKAGTFEGGDTVGDEEENLKAKEIMTTEIKPKMLGEEEDSDDDDPDLEEDEEEESSDEEDLRR